MHQTSLTITRRSRTGFAAAVAATAIFGSLFIASGSATAAPKKGSACTKGQLGKASGSLVCAKVATKYRWQAVATPTAGSTGPVAAAAPASGASIGADVLSTVLGGSVTVAPYTNAIYGKSFNPDGRCSIEALASYVGGCQGTGTVSGVAATVN